MSSMPSRNRIELKAFRGQRQQGDVGRDDERTRAMPSRVIEEQDGVSARRDSGGHRRRECLSLKSVAPITSAGRISPRGPSGTGAISYHCSGAQCQPQPDCEACRKCSGMARPNRSKNATCRRERNCLAVRHVASLLSVKHTGGERLASAVHFRLRHYPAAL